MAILPQWLNTLIMAILPQWLNTLIMQYYLYIYIVVIYIDNGNTTSMVVYIDNWKTYLLIHRLVFPLHAFFVNTLNHSDFTYAL